MKIRILSAVIFLLSVINSYGQRYTIIGKGENGSQQCTGYIYQCDSYIQIHLSDMLDKKFMKPYKGQIDEKTIKYYVLDGLQSQTITKYQTSVGSNYYYFTFPPLYSGQGYITYKTTKDSYGGIPSSQREPIYPSEEGVNKPTSNEKKSPTEILAEKLVKAMRGD